jgi:hypothetical protein
VNGANPRRYDFKTALDRVVAEAEPGDLVLYEPVYLASVVGYYAPDADAEALEEVDVASVPADRSIWIVAMQRSSSDATTQARVGEALQRSEGTRRVVQQFVRSNVEVWELRP